MAGPVILTKKQAFPRDFDEKPSPPAYYVRFDWSGWIVLIKSEIPNTTGMVWPLSSDKWKARYLSTDMTTKASYVSKNIYSFEFVIDK